jgi:NAD(P)-dependent dehydrogenase (short-subunit alcohol dehydrogenase family)
MHMQLHPGQVAVVTGGASGIGLALTTELVRRGLHVVVADIREDAAAQVSGTLGADATLPVAVDVRDARSVAALAAATLRRFGRVDLVCNNAGVASARLPAWEQPVLAWTWALDVMLMGVIHGVREFVPHLIAQGGGHVLNTASLGGLMPLPSMAPYAVAKHAVVGLTETLAVELDGTGVGTTVLCPGFVPTALARTTAENVPTGLDLPLPDPGSAPPGTGMTADDVALAALAGIEADALHVVCAAGRAQPARDRIARLLADLPH